MLVARSGTFDSKLKQAVEMDSVWAITLTLRLSCCWACYITMILCLNALSFSLFSHVFLPYTAETSNIDRLFTSMNACVEDLSTSPKIWIIFNSLRQLSTQNYFHELSIIPILITHFRSYAQGFNKNSSGKSSFKLLLMVIILQLHRRSSTFSLPQPLLKFCTFVHT